MHPQRVCKIGKMQLALGANKIAELYHIDNFTEQASLWYDVCTNRKHTGDSEMRFVEPLNDTAPFPAIARAIRIALALPVITCTIERP